MTENIENTDKTALMYACEQGEKIDLIERLIDKQGNINAKDKEDKTALMYAAFKKDNEKIIDLLLRRGAEFTARDNKKKLALMYACEIGDKGNVKELTKVGSSTLLYAEGKYQNQLNEIAYIDCPDNKGKTPLMYASERDLNCTKLLIASRAKTDSRDKEYNSALVYASKAGKKNIVIYLIKFKTEHDQIKKAIDSAAKNNKFDIVNILLDV